MKFWRRALSVLLAGTAFLAAFPHSAFGSPDNFRKVNTYHSGQFSDVSENAWYADEVRSVYELGLMEGSGGVFDPLGSVTLAQAVAMAARIHSIYTTGSESFRQTGPAWYSVYVDYAKRSGILDRDFPNYNAPAARAQFAGLFARALPASALGEINRVADDAIPDVRSSQANGKEIYLLYRAGVLTGSEGGQFRPYDAISRGEAAAVAARMALPSKRIRLSAQGVAWRGDPALDFTVELSGGGSFTLSEQAGKVVLVNFWATWCGPCVREMPDLEKLYEEYSPGGQVEIIAVNVGEAAATVQRFLDQQGYAFQVCCDGGGEISKAFDISSIPRTVIFGRDGSVAADFTGAQLSGNYERLQSAIESALAY